MARHDGGTEYSRKPAAHCLQTAGGQNIDQIRLKGFYPREKGPCACMVFLVPAVGKILSRVCRILDIPFSVRCPRNQVSRNKGPVDSAIVNEPSVGAKLGDNSSQRGEDIRFPTIKDALPTSL